MLQQLFTIVILGMYALLALEICVLIARAVLKRVSPKYAAKRQLKEQQRYERRAAKRRATRQRKEDRKRQWAEAHPDHPAAQAYLKQASAESSLSVSLLSGNPDTFDPAEELRDSQRQQDEYEGRINELKAAAERKAQRLLDWAIDNPGTPEGRRHLSEKLAETVKELEHVNIMVSIQTDDLDRSSDEAEAIGLNSDISEYKARKRDLDELLQRIRQALASSTLSDNA
jgi:hypothetical protein